MFRFWISLLSCAAAVGCALPKQPQPAPAAHRVNVNLYMADVEPNIDFTRCIKRPNHPELWATESPVLTELDIERVYWTPSKAGQPTLGIDMTNAGAATLKRATKENLQKFIVVELNGKVVYSPVIMGVISKRALIRVDDEDLALLDAFAQSMGAQGFNETVTGKGRRRPVL